MIKKQLKNHIQLLAIADTKQNFDFDKFINKSQKILQDYDCQFRFLRSDSKKNGQLRVKINRLTGEYQLDLAINKKDNMAGMVYTILHELTHLINNHIFGKELTRKQAEVVADTVAIYFINKYELRALYLKSDVANKWDVLNYSNNYIDQMSLSSERYNRIISQINSSKLIIEKLYIGF